MKKFLVQLEDHGFTFDVTIEADTIEQAVRIAQEKHCEPRQVTITPRPTCAEPYPANMEEGEEIYELTHEIQGECSECKLVFLSNHSPDPSWPWTNANGDDRGYTTICYGCAQKRKEKGDFCPLFGEFYRNINCEGCPAHECPKARDRHFSSVRATLESAISLIAARKTNPPDLEEVRVFMENNEFGLAYDALDAYVGPVPLPAPPSRSAEGGARCALDAVRDMMKKGWKS
jgi:hypothetical protein